MRRVLLALVCVVTAGCGSGFHATRLALEDPIMAELRAIPAQDPPRLTNPFRLAVAPPRAGHKDHWSEPEREAIRSALRPLQEQGIVSDWVFIPAMVVRARSKLKDLRLEANNLNADALLVIGFSTDTDEYANPLSLLNLTIVGLWIVPAHHREAMTVAEAVMIDVRSGLPFALASGAGSDSRVRPLVYADVNDAINDARLEALTALGRDFVEKADGLRHDAAGDTKPRGRRYETPGGKK